MHISNRIALIAMALAILAVPAFAQDPEKADKAIAEAKAATPSTIEIGVGGVSEASFKAGEFNGLQKSGAFLLSNIDVYSKSPYDSTSAMRWRINATDLGLESRHLAARTGVQGKFRLLFAYDELLRNQSDTYQTPYDGAGTNLLTVPSTWQVPLIASPAGTTLSARGLVQGIGTSPYLSTAASNMGARITPTAAQISAVESARLADIGSFHNVNLSTKRTRVDIGGVAHFAGGWSLDALIRPEHKDGLRPLGTISRNVGGDISMIMPDRIDTNHNQASANLNFAGKKSYAQVGYYGSYFTNHVASMSWQNWATGPTGTGTLNTMSSTPSNTFVQFNGSAGVKTTATTKLVVNGSYGRGTQNEVFLTDSTTPVVPVTSLNGVVVNSLFQARWTARLVKKLNLNASYKYNNRDNQTPINIYQYADTGEAPRANALFPAGNPLGAVLAQNANANRPYSRKANQAMFEADYSVAPGQWIKAGYDFERVDRSCPGAWISCADADRTNENTLRAEWRTSGYLVSARVGYSYSARRTPLYNENAFLAVVPYANVSPVGATGGATAYSFMIANGWNGWGPAAGYAATTGNMNLFFPSNNVLAQNTYGNGNRISELAGMRRYYVADRNRQKLRTMLNVQATDYLSFQGGVDINNDDYPDAIYGLQSAKSWAANIQGSYAVADDISADVFYTYEDQRMKSAGNTYTANSNASSVTGGQPGVVGLSGNTGCDPYTTLQQRNNNNKLDGCLNWTADMPTKANTAGFGLSKRTPRADVSANLVFSRVSWDNTVTGGNWVNNPLNGLGAPAATFAAVYIPATPTPTVTTNSAEFRLSGRFNLGPHQSLRLAYAYLRTSSVDYAYEGMQIGIGTIAGVLPTNEQAFNYRVNMFGASYLIVF